MVDFPDDESMRISHEAIYQALYVQGRGALKRELVACLRTGRALRVPKARSRQTAWGHVTPDVLISERPVRSRGPRHPWALGGRSHHRAGTFRHWNLGRADDTLHPADPLAP